MYARPQSIGDFGAHCIVKHNACVAQIERQLGNIERVRTLYEKYLEWSPANCTAWCKFAEFEQQYLGEIDRARAIYELAIAQPILDMPEVLWKVCSAPFVACCWLLIWESWTCCMLRVSYYHVLCYTMSCVVSVVRELLTQQLSDFGLDVKRTVSH